ncbi:MAG: methionine synthase [Bacteroidales bacterium]|nr:methionine synthase [Bacteroidales bacterium]
MDGFRKALSERILVLDGGFGTMLQRMGLKGNSEMFNLTHPDAVASIHRAYIDAGADIITTNSFGASAISQKSYGTEELSRNMALEASRTARREADKAGRKVWVAGSMGPTGKSLSLAGDMDNLTFREYSFDQMADAFEEQARGLIEGGVDLILLETCFDALNTKAAIYGISRIEEASGIPLMISASLSDRSGRTLTGQTVEAFYRSVRHADPVSFGLNCSLGASDLEPLVAEVASWATCAVSCHPNAGLPDGMGEYSESPSVTAAAIRKMAENGTVNIVGGCCGTTPEHIREIAGAVRGLRPRTIPTDDSCLYVSGLESVKVDRTENFTNVGERTNVAGSRKFARLIAAGDYETGLQIASKQIEDGASIIDVNMDDAMLDSTAEMEKFLRHISSDPSVAKAALMIDSSHWDTLLAGLKAAQGKCIVNSLSLKEGEEVFLQKAKEIKRLGAALIVIAFDEEGQATTCDRKIEICARAYSLLTRKAGFAPSDIIFDVNVLPVGTGIAEHSRYGADFIEAVRWIKQNLPGCRTSGGISNLSFSFRGNNAVREAMHSVFLYHAVEAGLDMGIVNPGMLRIYDEIEPELLKGVEDVILDSDPEATERLTVIASKALESSLKEKETTDSQELDRSVTPVTERLVKALVSGDGSWLENDVKEAFDEFGEAVKVIDGPLMAGMAKVGELFGEGRMFLPQVVKSARTMKAAVEFLQPYMKESTDGSRKVRRPVIVLATVKGDVHDIGKNITGIVMKCNGMEVHDLGVMVPKEDILAKAEETGADLIGVSGLITPSLYQMEELCREMKSRGMDTPLLVGGAAASALHTAVKLAPLYDHVFYSSDASAAAVLARELVVNRERTEREEHDKQKKIAEIHSNSSRTIVSTSQSKAFDEDSFLHGEHFRNIEARCLSVDELLPFFDWNTLFAIWGLKASSPADEKRKLMGEAKAVLDRMASDKSCTITLSARFELSHREGDDILYGSYRIPMFRQDGGLSLADFLPSAEAGFDSQMGMFALSVKENPHNEGCSCPACRSEYGGMLSRTIRLTLAEAASEWLGAELQKQLPEGSGMKVIKPAAGYSSCPDHTLKRDILSLLPGTDRLGIELTESCAMLPDASICGFIFTHKNATYPEIRRISKEAVDEYAIRRKMTEEETSRFLGHLL